MRKNEREKQLPSRSQGLIAESNEPRGTQGRPQQVISPQLDEDRGPPCSWAQVEPPGSPWGRGSCSAARARSPGCGADTSPGQGRWQKQDVQTDEGCRLWGGGQGVLCQGSGMAPGWPQAPGVPWDRGQRRAPAGFARGVVQGPGSASSPSTSEQRCWGSQHGAL